MPKESDICEPSEAQVSDDAQRANQSLPVNSESTPPPKSDDAADVNGSGKQSKKTKRTPWFNVCFSLDALFVSEFDSGCSRVDVLQHGFVALTTVLRLLLFLARDSMC